MEIKVVVLVEAWSNRGKSRSMMRLIDDLKFKTLEELKDKSGNVTDRLAVGDCDGLRVGVSTQGDPGTCISWWFDRLVNEEHCELIFAACRPSTSPGLVGAAKTAGYKLIKVSTSLNVSDWKGEMFGVDLNQVDADCYRLMIGRFADAKAGAGKDVTAGEDAL